MRMSTLFLGLTISASTLFLGCDAPCWTRFTEVVFLTPGPVPPTEATLTPRGGGPPVTLAITGTSAAPQRVSVGSYSPTDFCITTSVPGMWLIGMGLLRPDGTRPVALTVEGGKQTCFPHRDIYSSFVSDSTECPMYMGYNNGF